MGFRPLKAPRIRFVNTRFRASRVGEVAGRDNAKNADRSGGAVKAATCQSDDAVEDVTRPCTCGRPPTNVLKEWLTPHFP
jgi:hypothetical protein